MNIGIAIKSEGVSKKYCKSLKKSMLYGINDIARNIFGMSSHSGVLRQDEFWAVDNVSFELKRGETLGIIGPNGSGKTTLLKMLNGIFWPDKGKITIKGKVGALIEVGAGFHPLLSGRENIYVNAAILGMKKKEADKKFDSIVEFADIGDFLDTPVKNYSSGMFVRLGFAVAVHCHPNVMLVDEVLAVGDEGFQLKCFNKLGELKKKGATVILVSHNMHAVSIFTDKVLLLNKGKGSYFEKVPEGIEAYTRLFIGEEKEGIEKLCSGNGKIRFSNVCIPKAKFSPGDSFVLSMDYDAQADYADVDIDVAVFTNREPQAYFQAENKAYNRRIDLLKGRHGLSISIGDMRINNAVGKVAVGIWSKGKSELLFWWRIPVEFESVNYSTGKNFLGVNYEIRAP